MKVAFFLNRLNHHQINIADEFYEKLGDDYKFVELCEPNEGSQKGDSTDFSNRPYLIQAWKNACERKRAEKIALLMDACVFGTIFSLPFQELRLKEGKLSFEVSERWLKRGIVNIFSPVLLKNMWYYFSRNWKRKPLYKLCSSAFAASDHYHLNMYQDKCYKWGYFTKVNNDFLLEEIKPFDKTVKIMWCARFLALKHPELALHLVKKLSFVQKTLNGSEYHIHLDMYGDGILLNDMKKLAFQLNVLDKVTFHGSLPNAQIRKAMHEHDLFLFTSDKHEGWGAVANEAMSEGCLLIGSDAIGAVPFLVKDGVNGLIFKNNNLDSLYGKVLWALEHPLETRSLRLESVKSLREVWSPKNAVDNLLQLINDLQNNKRPSIKEGPASVASHN